MPTTNQPKSPPWKDSAAKALLEKMVASGDINGLKPAEVYKLKPEFAETSKRLFGGRLRSVRSQVKKAMTASQSDKIAYDHDQTLYPPPEVNHRGEPRWNGSRAQEQLREDIDAGLHETMTPYDFWQSDEAYQDYTPKVFRKHVHQEIKTRKFYNSRKDKAHKTDN